ncbi:hypothetical protein APE_0628.1 [Aeropyrum pernix K1]|uniref:Uncharacterized protein n=1 Tax=Aeropyrum pernix (strain ATCC 700893 / DSM 11879 / JCM 9820 / NBRC 100138 / K1) TaxID=272557 RepID=Q9YEE8_AERPE|nr:hypothetical protein [Aeropyrum pernix]BAA79598.2 hypothetical protein APE_0628.1 [Aeropyrum pernix K1]
MASVRFEDLRVNGSVVCPRCRIPMYYASETVKEGGRHRITRFYVCPSCKLKLVDERIVVIPSSSTVEVEVAGDRKTIYRQHVDRPRRQARGRAVRR